MTLKDAKEHVGKGWHKLLEEYYGRRPKGVITLDVKEKFGGLRIADGGRCTTDWLSYVSSLEAQSLRTCEFCGDPGVPRNLNGWIKTTCQTCYNQKSKGE